MEAASNGSTTMTGGGGVEWRGGGGIGEDDRGRCFTTFLEKKDRLLQT